MSDGLTLDRDSGARHLRRAMMTLALGLLAAVVAKLLIWPPEDPESIWITWYFFRQQDAPMLVLHQFVFHPSSPRPSLRGSGAREIAAFAFFMASPMRG